LEDFEERRELQRGVDIHCEEDNKAEDIKQIALIQKKQFHPVPFFSFSYILR